MSIYRKLSILIVVLSVVVAGIVYHLMPSTMASHWGIDGQVDGYIGRFWGVFLMPLVLSGMLVLFWILPSIDPLKNNVEKFYSYYEGFILATLVFLFYMYILTLAWNLGARFPMGIAIIPALSALFYFVGVLLENAKRNWFVGIRTPWTMESDVVWEKTNKLGARLFKGIAILTLLLMVFPKFALGVFVFCIFAVIVGLFVYSYLVFKKENKSK